MAATLLASCKKDEAIAPAPVLSTQSLTTKPVAIIANQDSIPDGGMINIQLMKDSSSLYETALVFKHNSSDQYNFNCDVRYFPGFGTGSLSSVTQDSVLCAIQTTF